MENYLYIKVADKNGTPEAAALLERLEAGYIIATSTATNNSVHYVLFLPYNPVSDEDHELNEEELKIIEDNIDQSLKGIKSND